MMRIHLWSARPLITETRPAVQLCGNQQPGTQWHHWGFVLSTDMMKARFQTAKSWWDLLPKNLQQTIWSSSCRIWSVSHPEAASIAQAAQAEPVMVAFKSCLTDGTVPLLCSVHRGQIENTTDPSMSVQRCQCFFSPPHRNRASVSVLCLFTHILALSLIMVQVKSVLATATWCEHRIRDSGVVERYSSCSSCNDSRWRLAMDWMDSFATLMAAL